METLNDYYHGPWNSWLDEQWYPDSICNNCSINPANGGLGYCHYAIPYHNNVINCVKDGNLNETV